MKTHTDIINIVKDRLIKQTDEYKKTIFDELEKAIELNCEGATKTTYLARVISLKKFNKFPFNNDYRNIFEYIDWVNPNGHCSSSCSISNNFLKFCKLSPLFEKDFGEENHESILSLKSALDAQARINQKEKKETDVSWEFLQNLEKKLYDPKSDYTREDKLLYKLYINPGIKLNPRNDYGNVKIVNDLQDTKDKSCNYFIRGSNNIIFNEYKTSGKYGSIIRDVPKDIVDFIKTDNNWLFEYQDKRRTDNNMSKLVQRLFTKLASGQNITITTIRRAYASQIPTTDNVAEIMEDAENMMHSCAAHSNYQVKENDEGEKIKIKVKKNKK